MGRRERNGTTASRTSRAAHGHATVNTTASAGGGRRLPRPRGIADAAPTRPARAGKTRKGRGAAPGHRVRMVGEGPRPVPRHVMSVSTVDPAYRETGPISGGRTAGWNQGTRGMDSSVTLARRSAAAAGATVGMGFTVPGCTRAAAVLDRQVPSRTENQERHVARPAAAARAQQRCRFDAAAAPVTGGTARKPGDVRDQGIRLPDDAGPGQRSLGEVHQVSTGHTPAGSEAAGHRLANRTEAPPGTTVLRSHGSQRPAAGRRQQPRRPATT